MAPNPPPPISQITTHDPEPTTHVSPNPLSSIYAHLLANYPVYRYVWPIGGLVPSNKHRHGIISANSRCNKLF
ncbi:hypothetical protein AYI70_g9838 [Smittium culicis]|uniref:Uncharacterized protein n=1 Tax=Smittium culicis TaxID=133412 RepID=A0A1R1X9F4_9FUNG|nr:hypothetical protein AYI70_g9838 [Smittium culicis]